VSGAPNDPEQARARVRQLLLSGDNMIKNRDNPERFARARERYAQAREVAVGAGLGSEITTIIDLRLSQIDADDEAP
jgi:hypothetical protein